MKKRHLHTRLRKPAPRFLDRPRELHGTFEHVDEPETIERIRAAVAMCDTPTGREVPHAEAHAAHPIEGRVKATPSSPMVLAPASPSSALIRRWPAPRRAAHAVVGLHRPIRVGSRTG
jgi:hypothetical protein